MALVSQTGTALQGIVGQVADFNGVVAEIAASAQEQATALAEVNTAVNQMDQVTQQNAAMVEQSTAASHGLMKEADKLARLLGAFQLGAVSVVDARRPLVPTLKLVSTRRTLRQPPATEAAESWAEF